MAKYLFIFIASIITSCTHVPSDNSAQPVSSEQVLVQDNKII
ncbi:MAG: hypothetical protein R8N50_02385 [Alphaproteobacteria bacterium]|nr:hypothetical protein [Alphaproteobacteria bacterium]